MQLYYYKKSIIQFLKLISCFFAFHLLLTSCNETTFKQEVKKASNDSVITFALKKESVNKQLNFPAELIALEKAEIFSRVSGYISTIKADIGDRVREGQVLVILDAPEISSNLAQANAEMQTAVSKYEGSLDTYTRITNASRTEGTIAANELEKVKSQMMSEKAAVEASKSKMATFQQMKNYLTIRAPFNGIITRRNMDVGTLVGMSNAQSILTIENTSRLRIRVPVPEAYTASKADSSLIHFTVDAMPGKIFTAKLSRKAGSLDLNNRTETWEFIYPNDGNQLKAGMFANAVLRLGRNTPTFLVPATAVATNLENRFVIRLKDGIAEWVDVKNGIFLSDKVEIFGIIEEGDILLLRATDEIKPGKKLYGKLLIQN
jgi:membrane fusion protein, multidrug efflux system